MLHSFIIRLCIALVFCFSPLPGLAAAEFEVEGLRKLTSRHLLGKGFFRHQGWKVPIPRMAASHERLVVDPYGKAARQGIRPSQLNTLDIAILSTNSKYWQIIPGATSVRLGASQGHNRAVEILRHSQIRDLNQDGHREHLVKVALEQSQKELLADKQLGKTIHVSFISITRGGQTQDEGLDSGEPVYLSSEASAPLDESGNCTQNIDEGNVVISMTCLYTEFAEVDIADLVTQLNTDLMNTNTGREIMSDATIVVEATGGEGPPQRKGGEGDCHTGNPGEAGYAGTARSLEDIPATTLYLYVGANAPNDTFTGGSSSMATSSPAQPETPSDPETEGMIVLGGGGGAGGGWQSGTCCAWGGDGGNGGIANNFPTDQNDTGPGGHGGSSGDDTETNSGAGGQNGVGGKGACGGTCPGRDGTDGIGGFAGEDSFSSVDGMPAQSQWPGSNISQFESGMGGAATDSRGHAAGGGGWGGGGGSGSGGYFGGGGGGASWALQTTQDQSFFKQGATTGVPSIQLTFSTAAATN